MAGRVRVDGQVIYKPATRVREDARITIDSGPRFVSRGGEKLDAAIQAFAINVTSRICADVGASTGGFTDCLLQYGASRVYAIDVGRGQLHWKLRNDDRVISMEGTNARYLSTLPDSISLATIDASFISIRLLLPAVQKWFPPRGGDIIALIKPQFEAGREEASRGRGIIRDPDIHRRILLEINEFAASIGLISKGVVQSPLKGPKGNIEFLVCFQVISAEL
jgi:23S rRNA (cytidine1920-2'-O)/16S rRNA (cytidine1409-2'-O)-methyltransferase